MQFPEYRGMSYAQASQEVSAVIARMATGSPGRWVLELDRLNALRQLLDELRGGPPRASSAQGEQLEQLVDEAAQIVDETARSSFWRGVGFAVCGGAMFWILSTAIYFGLDERANQCPGGKTAALGHSLVTGGCPR